MTTFAAVVYRDFRILLGGLLVQSVGGWMQQFALGWLVVELAVADGTPTLAPLYLGLTFISRGIPGIIVPPFAGVLADRVPDRRILLAWLQVGQLAAGLALALFTLLGHINIGWLIALNALNAATQSGDNPVRQAMLSGIVPTKHLMSAVGLTQMVFQSSAVLGPLVGGFLIGPIGIGGIFLVKTFTHLPLLGVCLAMSPSLRARGSPHRNPWNAMGEALRYVLGDPILRLCLVFLAVTATLGRSFLGLLPAVTHDFLGAGPVELSWLLVGTGIGSVVGASLLAPLGALRRRGFLLAGMIAGSGFTLSLLALQRELLPAVAITMLSGLASMLAMGVCVTFFQMRTPDHLRGRVLSFQPMAFGGLSPIGVMLIGSLATLTRLDIAIIAAGALSMIIAVGALAISPLLRSVGPNDAGLG